MSRPLLRVIVGFLITDSSDRVIHCSRWVNLISSLISVHLLLVDPVAPWPSVASRSLFLHVIPAQRPALESETLAPSPSFFLTPFSLSSPTYPLTPCHITFRFLAVSNTPPLCLNEREFAMHRTYSMRQSRAPTASQVENPPPPLSTTKSGRWLGKGGFGE